MNVFVRLSAVLVLTLFTSSLAPESVPSLEQALNKSLGKCDSSVPCQATQEVTLSRSAEKEVIYPPPIDRRDLGAVVFSVIMVIGGHDLGVGGVTNLPDILILPVG